MLYSLSTHFSIVDIPYPTAMSCDHKSPETVLVIEPGERPLWGELRDLLHYRDLLYFLVRREIAVRYKQTFLGVFWAVLQPFATMVVFSIFLGRFARMPSDGIPYPVFAYLGLLPWGYFSGSVQRSSASLVGNANLLTKVYFPRVLIPLSAILAALVDFMIAGAVLVIVMLAYGMVPAVSSLLFLPLTAITGVLALGMGMWLAALNVQYRDIQHAAPFLIQIWMFATPIVYPYSIVPERYRLIYELNPMVGVIKGFRAAALGEPLDWPSLGVALAGGVVFLAAGFWQFRRMDRTFADLV